MTISTPADDCLRRLLTIEKIRIYDVRAERPPHYDTFAEFQYSYHYGDSYIPHVKQEEPLKVECQHFIDCIVKGMRPLTGGRVGLELVRVLEAASASLSDHGSPVGFARPPRHLLLRSRKQPGGQVHAGLCPGDRAISDISGFADVKLGRDVQIHAFVNLYGCEIATKRASDVCRNCKGSEGCGHVVRSPAIPSSARSNY